MISKLNVCAELEALWEWEQASLCAMIQSPAWTSRQNPCYFYSCRLRGTSYCKETVADPQVSHPLSFSFYCAHIYPPLPSIEEAN